MAVLVATITSVGVADSISVNNLDRNCLTAEQSKDVSTFVLTPTEFPENYSLGCVAINHPNEVSVIISENTVTSNEWQGESLNPSGTNIFLHEVRETGESHLQLGTAEQRIRDTIADIQEKNPKLNPVYFNINGMPAYGIDSCGDCGTQTAEFGDGSVITNTYDIPSKLKIISDDGNRYSFYGYVPLDDLVKLGNSLQ